VARPARGRRRVVVVVVVAVVADDGDARSGSATPSADPSRETMALEDFFDALCTPEHRCLRPGDGIDGRIVDSGLPGALARGDASRVQ